jgi:hypothetical protein
MYRLMTLDMETGQLGEPGRAVDFRRLVVQLGLSEQQLAQLAACHLVFEAKAAQVLRQRAQLGAQLAAAQVQQPQEGQQRAPGRGRELQAGAGAHTGAAAADAAAAPQDPVLLLQQLERSLRKEAALDPLMVLCMVQTLAWDANARLVVLSYPYAPNHRLILKAAHELLREREAGLP